ncbi:MAG TPA: MgtC/SapB family protein, partial [Steroidobacteraceae bacterium]|nr:MgtC/SapB family protein [Steroidobacteraceae bacterium]
MPDVQVTGIATAIGIGLMIGIERERAHAGEAVQAGVRTYTLVALLGALAVLLVPPFGLIAFALAVAGFAALSYRRTSVTDPGLTTEVALVLTYMLGALAMTQPILAGGIGVLVTILLASRTRLHGFVLDTLTAH